MKSLAIFALATVLSAPAFGKDKEKKKPDKGAAPAEGSSTSEHLRKGKRAMVALELLGVQTQMGLGSGIRGGYYLSSDSIIEGQLAFAEAKYDSDSFSDSDYSAGSYDGQRIGEARLFEVRFKHFATNSFYWSAGLGDRQTEAELVAYRFLSEEDRETVATASTHDIGVSFTIGNQWQWETFMMGCDWIGLYQPLIHVSQSKSDQNSPTDESDRKSVDSMRDEFYKDETEGGGQGLRLYLGASF